METKKWYASKTIRAQIIAVASLGLTQVVNIDEATQSQIVDTIMTIVWVVSQVIAIYGRIVADKKIG